jgi:hypothetical protein
MKLRPEKGCAGDAQQKLKLQIQLHVREGAPHQQIRNCVKIIKEGKEKNWSPVPDRSDMKTDLLTDCWS